MSNNNNYYQNERNKFDPAALVAGLEEVAAPLNKTGVMYQEQTFELETKFENMIADVWGITEIDHVMVFPVLGRNGQLEDIACVAYFNTHGVSAETGNIARVGGGKKSNNMNIAELAGLSTTDCGGFVLSDKFKTVMSVLSKDYDNKINVKALPQNKNIAVMDLDFNSMLGAAMKIKSDSSYNFTVLSAAPVAATNGSKYSNYSLVIAKFIDLQRKQGRRNKFDYRSIDRDLVNRRYGSGNGGSRSFQ